MTTTEALQACREIDPGRSFRIALEHYSGAPPETAYAPYIRLYVYPNLGGPQYPWATCFTGYSLEDVVADLRSEVAKLNGEPVASLELQLAA